MLEKAIIKLNKIIGLLELEVQIKQFIKEHKK